MTDIESAIADIQLYGSARQVALTESFAKEFASRGSASLDGLMAELRDDLRKELELEPIGHGIIFLRIINHERDGAKPDNGEGSRKAKAFGKQKS